MSLRQFGLVILSITLTFAAPATSPVAHARLLAVSPFLGSNNLYDIDADDASPAFVGGTGLASLIGLAAGPDGTVYTIRAGGEPTGERALYTLNPNTGLGTHLFGLGVNITFIEGDLAVNSTGDSIYIARLQELYRIDLGPQTLTSLGELKFNGNPLPRGVNVDGLSFRGNTLYGLITEDNGDLGGALNDHLIRINPDTLDIADVGPLGINIGFLAGLAYDPGRDLFYTTGEGNTNLYSVSPITGAATLIGNHGINNVSGLTFLVPEPSAAVFVMLGLGLAISRRLRSQDRHRKALVR